MEPYQNRERQLTEAKQGIQLEKEKHREILGIIEEDEDKEMEQSDEDGITEPKGEEFEVEKLKVWRSSTPT